MLNIKYIYIFFMYIAQLHLNSKCRYNHIMLMTDMMMMMRMITWGGDVIIK